MEDDTIVHYGTPRHSGRYPWGSGGAADRLVRRIEKLEAEGFSETEIGKALGYSTTELRNQKSLAKQSMKEAQRLHVIAEKERGKSIASISRDTGLPPSSIRDMLKDNFNKKFRDVSMAVSYLKDQIDNGAYMDVGKGVEHWMGISRTKLDNAIQLLKNDGYKVWYIHQEQLGTDGNKTSLKVLVAPEVEWKEANANRLNIKTPMFHIDDDVGTYLVPDQILNVDSKRVLVRYNDDGGGDKDGLIELRRGVPELDIGTSSYAQVRIGVDGTHYMKGMAVTRDDLPDGVDIVYNTSKDRTSNKLDAMKEQKLGEGEVSAFGAVVKPNTYLDKDGNTQFGAVNIVGETNSPAIEGAWSDWNNRLASQVLSKQSAALAKKQLDIVYQNNKAEFDEIMTISDPTVKGVLLKEFSDKVDRAAVDLQAAALPRQTTNVLLPDPSMKPNEVYAPNYDNGEVLSLVRYPHGGVFEIPTLTVNNKYSDLRGVIGTAPKDAIAIHPSVAQKLSGADFDGDFVLAIPNKSGQLRTAPSLDDLKNFDPKTAYPYYDGMKVMSEKQKQRMMGDVSNLITDMTIKGASESEIARAVKHSMVVIDAAKHELNYKQSHDDNGIAALKRTYQGSARSGASTLISRAKSQKRVPDRMDRYSIDPETGEKVWTHTDEVYTNKKTGKVTKKMIRSTKMAEESDARALIDGPGTVIENVYAEHANKLKSMGNQARLATIGLKGTPYSKTARQTYSKELESLDAKLFEARKAKPIERQAQILAGEIYSAKLSAKPGMSWDEKSKAKGRSIQVARARLGASKPVVTISPREWEAIEMGAVSKTKLASILRHSDMDVVRKYATPRTTTTGLSTSKTHRAKALLGGGYTAAEVARALGVPVHQIRDLD